MRALSFTLVAASLLLAGCLGLGGSEQAPAEANPASSQDEPNATNTSTNASTPATEPTGPAYAGYTPPGNASVTVRNGTELTFSPPAGGFHEILLEPESPTEFNAFTYGGGGGAHDLSTFGLVLLPPDPEAGAAEAGPCRSEPGLSWWTTNLFSFSSDWELDERPHLLIAWSNGGDFSLSSSSEDGESETKNVSLDPSNVTARATEPEIRSTSSGPTSSTVSFEATLEPSDWGILSFQGNDPFASGSYSVQATATSGGTECANHEESGTATPYMNSSYEATFPLRLGSEAVGWTGQASYQVSPGSAAPENQFRNVQAYALHLTTPS